MTIQLRFYQEDAVNWVRQKYAEAFRAVLLVLSTGAGKTVIFSYIAMMAAQRGNRVLILAHRDTLIKQASRKLADYGVDHGIIMAGVTPNHRAKVQVGSVQTMVRRIDKMADLAEKAANLARKTALNQGASAAEAESAAKAAAAKHSFDMIVIDEAHLSAAKSYRDVVAAFPKARVLGVTGSPCRLDNKGLGVNAGGLYDEMIVGISIKELIDHKFLVRPAVYAPANKLDLSGVRQTGGDYNAHDLELVVDRPSLVGDAADQYMKICPGVPAIAWCVTVAHAQHVADHFNARGIKAVMLSGEATPDERDKTLSALSRGEIKVVTFCNLLVEGVDCPAIEAVILLRPTQSLASYLQVIGRGLRPHGNKDRCYVLDHAGCTFTHGFADEIRDWSLDGMKKKGKKKKDDDPEVKAAQCGKCYRCFTPAEAIEAGRERGSGPCCPYCGHRSEVKERKIEQVDGELQEITAEVREAMRREARRQQGAAQTVEQLVAIGKSRWEAERIVKARAEKQEVISGLIADLTTWQQETGQMPFTIFGVSYKDIRFMKPKDLKALRDRFEQHKAEYLAAQNTGEFQLEVS